MLKQLVKQRIKSAVNKLLYPNYRIVRSNSTQPGNNLSIVTPKKPAAAELFTKLQASYTGDALKIELGLNWPLLSKTLNPDHLSITVDIYPSHRPAHPERHFGHFDFKPKVSKSGHYSLTIHTKNKKILNHKDLDPLNHWQGRITEPGEYKITILLRENHNVFAEAGAPVYIGEAMDANNAKLVSTQLMKNHQRLKSAVWFITWKCNMKCQYCWEVQRIRVGDLKPEPYKDYKNWVRAWNKLKPEILDISGGEPFLQPNFLEMLEEFDDSIKVAITTNLSLDITKFVQRIKPSKIASMTLSLHPTQKLSLEHFKGKLLLLKNRGFGPLTVNFVTWPEQMYLLPEYKALFEGLGVRFHVDPYSATPFDPYEFNAEEETFIKDYVGSDRAHWFGDQNTFNVVCSGGIEHLNVGPDGQAHRCIHDRHMKIAPVGNILDEDFSLNKDWTFCPDFWRCPGCDKDKIRTLKLKTKNNKEAKSKWDMSL